MSAERPTSQKTKLVLVVDDEQELCDLYADFLKEEGFDVIRASSGEEALKSIESRILDIIVSDLQMPGMNGLELIAKTRSSSLNKDTPVVLISGEISSAITKTAEQLRVEEIFVKPVSFSALVDRLKLLVA